MTVYQRMANAYEYLGGPNAMDVATLYAGGELGQAYNDKTNNRSYALVKVDSGATSATPTGAPAASQLAFWKDRANFIVTNDKRFAGSSATSNGAVNNVAGIFPPIAVTPGNYTMIVIAGNAVPVAGDNAGTEGIMAIADTTASTARVTALATATTAPTSQVIGRISGTPSGGLTPVDVMLGFLS